MLEESIFLSAKFEFLPEMTITSLTEVRETYVAFRVKKISQSVASRSAESRESYGLFNVTLFARPS